jgi:sugar lactone lactonase YvrE
MNGQSFLKRWKRNVVTAALLVCGAAFAPAALEAQSVSYTGTQSVVPVNGLLMPWGLAVDGAGDVFVAEPIFGKVVKVPANGAAQTSAGSGFTNPYGVAADAAGNVFIVDSPGGFAVEIPANGGQQITLASGLNDPYGVAVDKAGDVFIADTYNHRVLELPAGGGAQISVGSGLVLPVDLKVDAQGNLYIADRVAGVVKIPAGGGQQVAVPISGLNEAMAVAMDAAGNLFVADYYNSRVVELPANGGPQMNVPLNGTIVPAGLAVDARGNLLVSDDENNVVVKWQSGVVDFGSLNVCPGGQASPAPCSQTMTLNYVVNQPGTLGTPRVVTQGAPNLDFTAAAGSTCSGEVTAGSTCTVNVTFAPTAPGVRKGAVQVVDASGNVLATTLVGGTGVGPQMVFNSVVPSTLASGLSYGNGVAIDDAGNVYVADSTNARVLKVPAGGGSPTPVGSGLIRPTDVAVDGAGNVYIQDAILGIVKVPAGGGAQSVYNPRPFGETIGLAVDRQGNLYFTGDYSLYEVKSSDGSLVQLPSSQNFPGGLAVDGQGDVFISNNLLHNVVEIPAGSNSVITVVSNLISPTGLAVDGGGNLYIGDDGAILEVPAGATTPSVVAQLNSAIPTGLAVDRSGNLYYSTMNQLMTLPRSQAPSLTFASTSVGKTSSDSPKSVEVENIGNASLNFTNLSVAPNFAQVDGSGTSTDCSASTSLAPGVGCNVSLSFTPIAAGAISGSVVLTDNALNGNPAVQTIQLNGTGTQVSQTITFSGLPATATFASAGPYTLNATSTSGLAVSYSVSGPATISGNILTITGAGAVVVTASQAGSAEYTAATSVSQTITVSAASQTITFPAIAAQKVGASVNLSASATSGLAVSFTSTTPAVCSVSGSTANMVAAGTCSIVAAQPGNANYSAAPTVTQSIVVTSPASFTITPVPGTETISRGVIGAFLLELQSVGGFNGNVTLGCSGGPAGSQCANLPETVNVSGTALAVSGILFPKTAKAGTYTLTFTGTSGSVKSSTTATFIVK